jgi:hemolysin activation/secretion protein
MNFNCSLGWTYKFNKNMILNQDRSLDEATEYSVNFTYDSLDRFLGKNIASLGYQWGQVERDKKLATSRSNTEDISYDFYRLNLARIQKIYGYTNIMLRVSGQYSDKRLLPMDQMGLGGYGTVRGYDPSLYLGDSGASFSAELMFAPPFLAENSLFGFRLAQLVQFALFWDYGQVFTTDADANNEPSTHYLSGYGFGIRLFYKDWFTFKYDLGIPKDQIEGKPSAFNYVQCSFNLF